MKAMAQRERKGRIVNFFRGAVSRQSFFISSMSLEVGPDAM